ncbi:UNVERIFIED_CONTAM: terminase family protein, partial [Kocuria sp. CPCC 205274]
MDYRALETYLESLALDDLNDEQRQQLYEVLKPYQTYKRYNRLEWFEPRQYQREYMNAGKDYNIRYLRAGNRTGKTYGAANEFAYHITGRYPDWWEGARIEGGGHTFWAVGITLDSVATVIQKELFGTADIRTEDVGTGTIPKDAIERGQGWQPDGSRLKSCMIRHKSGQLNTLRFYGSENVAVMMGAKCALIWMDEEAFNGMEVYTQCVTRLINAFGTCKNGYMMLTATPERGNTELNQLFDNDESGLLFMRSASWDDIPGMTEEQIEQELAKYPKWQHEMRRNGLPVIGTGAIFPYSDEQITVSEVVPGPHWQILRAIDWGVSHDPTVIVEALFNPDTNTYYIYDCIYLDKSDYDRSPA